MKPSNYQFTQNSQPKSKVKDLQQGNVVINYGIVKQIFPLKSLNQIGIIFDPQKEIRSTKAFFHYNTILQLA